MKVGNLVLLLLLVFFEPVDGQVFYQPQQIHLSYGDDTTEMVVTWSTFSDTNESVVEFGNDLSVTAIGNCTLFTDGGKERRMQYIHRVKLLGLKPQTRYLYRCGSKYGWSSVYYFNTPPNGSNWSPHIVLYGDLGNENAQSLPRLQDEVEKGMYDAVLHVGDFAYDMDTNNGRIGDEFMQQIQPIATLVPYMTCVGNHEHKYNFSHYKNRFSMPGSENSLMYSFNLGPIHFVAFSSEFYYFLQYGLKQVVKQFNWLQKDLEEANRPENRQKQPWIVTFGHRPMYCSNILGIDCAFKEPLVRVGIPFLHWFGLESLFYNYGVDLQLYGHQHSYERLWPIYNKTVYNGSLEYPYTNPGAPVHIITGSAGCREKHSPFKSDPAPWSAFRSTDYGYTRMKVFNASHLFLEQVSDDKSGEIIDQIWIIKDKHGAYRNNYFKK